MIKEKIINGKVFLEQTTYYVYNNEEDRKKIKHMIMTSDKSQFKRLIKDEEMKINALIQQKTQK